MAFALPSKDPGNAIPVDDETLGFGNMRLHDADDGARRRQRNEWGQFDLFGGDGGRSQGKASQPSQSHETHRPPSPSSHHSPNPFLGNKTPIGMEKSFKRNPFIQGGEIASGSAGDPQPYRDDNTHNLERTGMRTPPPSCKQVSFHPEATEPDFTSTPSLRQQSNPPLASPEMQEALDAAYQRLSDQIHHGREYQAGISSLPARASRPHMHAPDQLPSWSERSMQPSSTFRVKPKEPAKYDGRSDLVDYLTHFAKVAKLNGWSYEQSGLELATSLTGEAREVLSYLPLEQEDD